MLFFEVATYTIITESNLIFLIIIATGRIAPDRRWFGNTRVVGQTELDKFREEMTSKVADPYSVVLKRKKLPMGLLQDAAVAMMFVLPFAGCCFVNLYPVFGMVD